VAEGDLRGIDAPPVLGEIQRLDHRTGQDDRERRDQLDQWRVVVISRNVPFCQ